MMMKMMINKRILLLALIIKAGMISAQETDFGIWGGISASHEITDKLDAELKLAFKAEDRLSVINQYYVDGNLSYKVAKWLETGVAYRLISKYEDDSAYHFRNRIYGWFKGSIDIDRLKISLRAMYQRTTRQYIENANDAVPERFVRLKLTAEYDMPSSPLRPFFYAEPYIPIADGDGFEIQRARYSAGLEYKISKKSSFEAGWVMEAYKKRSLGDLHVLNLEYKLKF